MVRSEDDGDSVKLSTLPHDMGAGLADGKIWIDLRFTDENSQPVHLRATVVIPGGTEQVFVNDLDTPKTNGGIAILFPVQVRNFKAKTRLSVRFIFQEENKRIEYRTDRTIASS